MSEKQDFQGLPGSRPRTISNASQQSQQSSKQNFPQMNCDSGLYTCSSNASDCSLPLESDTDSGLPTRLNVHIKDERLQLALQDVSKLRSELERLSKSEQWYKQELRQQKTLRLDDLERIYSQERKFMQENQRLQKECVRLYEKCNELEREVEKQGSDSINDGPAQHLLLEEQNLEENVLKFEKEQQLALIKDQQQLITVLRKQKRSLLQDLRSLTEEKDEKVMDLQRLLADLEYDNKLITKKCTQFAKERVNLENNLKQQDSKLSETLQDKMNLQKSLVDLKEQLELQQQLLSVKEKDIKQIQELYTEKIQNEQDLDQVHKLSIKYQEEINNKTLEIINLKERLQQLQDEMEDVKLLQQQNDSQQRKIEQLNYTLETYRLELQELKTNEENKNQQLQELNKVVDHLINDKESMFKTTVQQQNDLLSVKKALKNTQDQYEHVGELYKKTKFQLELLELEQGKFKFQSDKDQQEINLLRVKLKEYLQQTKELTDKLQFLEQELLRATKENSELKEETKQMQKYILEIENKYEKESEQQILIQQQQAKVKECDINEDEDFLKLHQQCENLQAKLDFFQTTQARNYLESQTRNDFVSKIDKFPKNLEEESDFEELSVQTSNLQENLQKLNDYYLEKQQLIKQLSAVNKTNEGMKKLVIENEFLKKKLNETEKEATSLQIKQAINERTKTCIQTLENLEIHKTNVEKLQESLLENDGKLYKMERKLRYLQEKNIKLQELQIENENLKEKLRQEQLSKTDLYKKLQEEKENLRELKKSLMEIKEKQQAFKHQSTQCNLLEKEYEFNQESKQFQEQLSELQQQQRHFLEQEALKKEERLQFLHKMLEIQNSKMENLQKHQQDWQEMLTSLNNAQAVEEKTRQELELKRQELEELNQVFSEQNEELRRLEEFTVILDHKRQQEKEQMKQTFQQKINVMKQHLHDCQQEVEQQKYTNQELEKRNTKYQQNISEDYATEVAEYRKEIRELKSQVKRVMEEKEDLKGYLKEFQKESKALTDNKREAVFMPEISLVKVSDMPLESPLEDTELLEHNISEDHLRILTKVLESEYQRKMQRYDGHIHTLLSNLKTLKKSLKINEEKTALLAEEQMKNKEELIDLQKTKINLQEMRLKYEQSQDTIKELRQSLAFERKKFELSDAGKSSQSSGTTTYEVSNLIDDYKKLIQQSALVTKRPSARVILDLIQRSQQCVPNLQKLESNVDDLKSELQDFLTSYNNKITAPTLIAAASLSVPPSLMEELRAASEGF